MQAETTAPARGKPKQRTVQATLRRVIKLGYYGSDVYDEVRREYSRQHYMCCALSQAAALGEITEYELDRATAEIDAYLGGISVCMARRLQIAGLWDDGDLDAFADTVGRQLYWGWNKRPSLD